MNNQPKLFFVINKLSIENIQYKNKSFVHYSKLNFSFIILQVLCFLIIDFLVNKSLLGVSTLGNSLHISFFSYFISVILIPIVEELIFRLGLVFSPFKSSLLVLGIISVITGFFLTDRVIDALNIEYKLFLLFIYIIFWLISWRILYVYRNAVELIWGKYFRVIFIVSILFFAYGHLTKYTAIDIHIFVISSPILILPFIISGYFLSLIRVRFGFIWGISSHIIANFLLAIISNFQTL